MHSVKLLSRATTALLAVMMFSPTATTASEALGVAPITDGRAAQMEASLSGLAAEHDLQTAGFGLIQDGELVWTHYWGEQRPGVAASAETLFDVASITKVVTAETVLRLADAGKLGLDESMSDYWLDPDLADDPRHEALTPRMVLDHTTGFPNWRFFLPEGDLKFLHDPGTTYGYSGEGFEYVARYAEEKLGRDFDTLVREQVIEPADLTNMSLAVREANFDQIARPLNEGEFPGYYCRPNGWCREPGSYSAADDLVVSVPDFAAFLIGVMEGQGYQSNLAQERFRVRTDKGDQAAVLCERVPEDLCPEAHGYALGWDVLDYGERGKVVSHGGSDWSEVALAYFYTDSRDGVVIFLNAPNIRAITAMPEAIRTLDPDSPLADLYERRAAHARARGDGG